MKTRIKPLNLLLLVSIPFLVSGLLLTISSYNRYLAVEAAAEQLEFIKNLPQSVNAGETWKMPVFCKNFFMEMNPSLRGSLSCVYYEGRISVRLFKASVRHGCLFSRTELEYLADARVRN
jgi:hypothetical protein